MNFLETANLKSQQLAFNLIRDHSEQDGISKEDAAILLAGNAIQIVAFMRGEAFARELFEAALATGLMMKKEALQ